MEISRRIIGDYTIVDLPEDIFVEENIFKFKKFISEIIEDGHLNLLLNMNKVTKIDGPGLAALIGLQKVAFYNEAKIRLYGLQPYVAQLMYITRLNRILDICKAEDEDLCEEVLSDMVMIA